MVQTITDTKLDLSREDFARSYHWNNKESACFTVKEDIIKLAFKDLRSKGYICRMNFLCCGTCASYDLNEMAEERGKLGYIYWHRQDQERMVEQRSVMLGYSSVDETVVSTESLGKHIVESFKTYINQSNLPVDIIWDGTAQKRIQLSW